MLDGVRRVWHWFVSQETLDSHILSTNLLSIGRTTFVNTLCGKKVLQHKESDDPTIAHIEEGVKIKPITVGTEPLCQLVFF